ncbi:MAG TPA: alpha/beta hydrolase family protein [Candidatus Omnitrophota bacterium]|nr:alpha/beta hydrolase family protein [Candidatus Omnitrophota bacterium]HPS37741.1 alpha/beta hydrolase family protein [Candidatus Omnitrophota bacterium]
MSTFVLVHGAYHGAWSWQKIIPFLREKGIPVFTPTLSGLGENSYLLSPSIDLSTHITDVAELLKREALRDVVLVGHSYAGFVISGVAERVPERIAHLVYLDAMVPESGQCFFDVRPDLRARVSTITFAGKSVQVLMPPSPEVFGVTDPEDVAWVKPLLTPTPAACYEESLVVSEPKVHLIPKTYLLNKVQDPGASRKSHEEAYARAQGGRWSRRMISGPHDSMITHPKQLAETLAGFNAKGEG